MRNLQKNMCAGSISLSYKPAPGGAQGAFWKEGVDIDLGRASAQPVFELRRGGSTGIPAGTSHSTSQALQL